jgi:hypothetical protein
MVGCRLLVARQGLVGQGIVGSALEKEIESGRGRLDNLLSKPTATIAEILVGPDCKWWDGRG